jgi:hypothetical protein
VIPSLFVGICCSLNVHVCQGACACLTVNHLALHRLHTLTRILYLLQLICLHTQVIEVASSTDAEGRVVYDPDELVLAIGQLILGQQQQPHTPASAAAAAAASIHGLSLSQ